MPVGAAPSDGANHAIQVCRACGLRFPAPMANDLDGRCPSCGGGLQRGPRMPALVAATAARVGPAVRVVGVLDNIRSARNVGAMLRTADAAGLEHLHLCGITATPAHATVAKTALGAQDVVPWTHHRDGTAAIDVLRADGWQAWVAELGGDATPLGTATAPLAAADQPVRRIAIVVGHEVAGVDPGILAMADRRVAIPMRGTKVSLNVATAFGVVAYAVTGLA